jgi:hypothetical protein
VVSKSHAARIRRPGDEEAVVRKKSVDETYGSAAHRNAREPSCRPVRRRHASDGHGLEGVSAAVVLAREHNVAGLCRKHDRVDGGQQLRQLRLYLLLRQRLRLLLRQRLRQRLRLLRLLRLLHLCQLVLDASEKGIKLVSDGGSHIKSVGVVSRCRAVGCRINPRF